MCVLIVYKWDLLFTYGWEPPLNKRPYKCPEASIGTFQVTQPELHNVPMPATQKPSKHQHASILYKGMIFKVE